MEINKADVAELVDARDLKSRAATDIVQYSCKTADKEPNELAAAPCRLQNRFELLDNGKSLGRFRDWDCAMAMARTLGFREELYGEEDQWDAEGKGLMSHQITEDELADYVEKQRLDFRIGSVAPIYRVSCQGRDVYVGALKESRHERLGKGVCR